MSLPRVSDVLRVAGVTSEYTCDPWYAQRGTNVHKATELFDKDILDFNTVGKEEEPFFKGWLKFRAEISFEIIEIEFPFVNEHLGYRTHGIDRIINIDGKIALIDLKCSKTFPSHIGQQTMAYKLGYEYVKFIENKEVLNLDRYGLLLPGNGHYSFKKLDNNTKDLTGWIKSLKTYKELTCKN